MFDVAIIGTGPAGLSAALTLKLHNKDIIWFGSNELSDKVGKSEKIANYPGVPMVSGADLNRKFREQAEELGLEPVDKRVTNIADMGGSYMILADNEMFEARTVLLSTGIAAAKGMENEARLLGAGVSYCATCDGFLYKGKTAAVYCTDERMEHDIKYLEEICGKLYIYTSFGYKTDAENAEILKLPVKKLDGGMKCDSIELTDGTKIDVDLCQALTSFVDLDESAVGVGQLSVEVAQLSVEVRELAVALGKSMTTLAEKGVLTDNKHDECYHQHSE